MNQILMYFLYGLGVLLFAMLIPGPLKLLAEAILKVVLESLYAIIRQNTSYVVWFIKTIISDHARVIRHATMSRDKIDPTNKVRRKADGYED